MNVALVTTAPVPGGVWRHIADLGRGLAERGCQVSYCVRQDARGVWSAAEADGLRPVPIRRALRSRPDVVHVHLHDTYEPAIAAWLARWAPAARAIATEHLPRTNASDPALLPGRRRAGAYAAKTAFKRAQFALVRRVIAVSHGSADFLTRRYGVRAPRLAVIPNGVRVRETAVAPQPVGPLRAVVLANLVRQKGVDVLVRAAAKAQREWTVDVLGEGSARATIEALIAREGGERVRLRGWVADPAAWVARADVVVVPSRWESMPYAAAEAMASGRPVVASRVDGLSELVVHEHTGLLVAPESPRELVDALDRLASDRELAAAMGAAGRRRVARHYGLGQMVDATLALYEESRG
ncbi:MAG: hypothetical protein V7607_747 [Solirubrobacteraceae bacterium]